MSELISSKAPIASKNGSYERYHIETQDAPDRVRWPSRFKVRVGRIGLAKMLVRELLHYGPKKEVILSRPCMYGVFSSPVGGFIPIEKRCVGCLRCSMEFPDFVRVEHNPAREKLGDSFFTFGYVDTASYESASGLIPVKGAGYRGKFGGEGWDGMWTDMSEIVRPTRDGIHGREFISTVVDIGYTPNFLLFDEGGDIYGTEARNISLPVPIVYDIAPQAVLSARRAKIFLRAAQGVGTLAVVPLKIAKELKEFSEAMAVLIRPDEVENIEALEISPALIEMDGWKDAFFGELQRKFPESVIALRTTFDDPKLMDYVDAGVSVFHLTANYHGRSAEGKYILDLIRDAHMQFVDAGVRQEVSLIGSGGLIAAEHVPKAILCGLDAVALDTPLMVAMQAEFEGECVDWESSQFRISRRVSEDWGVQRIMNLTASWRDQLLEILGAMGLREVRRLRGEMGRAMFMKSLEAEAFAGIEGYDG